MSKIVVFGPLLPLQVFPMYVQNGQTFLHFFLPEQNFDCMLVKNRDEESDPTVHSEEKT